MQNRYRTIRGVCLVLTFLLGGGSFCVSSLCFGETASYHINIQEQANQRLADDFPPGHYRGDNFSELTPGIYELGGTSFLVGESLIELAGKFIPNHPQRVEGIEVGRLVDSIRFLQGARWGAFGKKGDRVGHWVADGTPIGYYEINYADADSVAIPITYGVDVRDWWSIWDKSKPVERGEVVWTGSNPHIGGRNEARNVKKPLRLYMHTWKNPHPKSLVTSIEFVTLNRTATPFCVAITVEGPRRRHERERAVLNSIYKHLQGSFDELKAKINGQY